MHLDKRAITHAPLPRQESSTPTLAGTPTTATAATLTSSNKPDTSLTVSYNNTIKTKLPGWQIILIVLGGLFFVGVLFTLYLIIRSHIKHKQAKVATNLQLAGRGSSSNNEHGQGPPNTGGVFDNMDTPIVPELPKNRRESALMEARVKMRRLIKPRRTSDTNGFTIFGIGLTGKKGSGKDLDLDDTEEAKTMSPWSSNVTRMKSLVIHDSQNGSGLTSLAREQQEREGRYHQQLYAPSSHQSYQSQSNQSNHTNQYNPHNSHNQYSQYSRHYTNQNNRGSGNVSNNNSNNNSNSGRIHNEDNWMLSSDSVAHTIRESFDIVGSYQHDPLHSANGPGEDNYLESPPTTGLGHEVIPLESRLGPSHGSSSVFGFSGFKFGHDRRKPG